MAGPFNGSSGDSFVGAGLAFPLRLDAVGSVALVSSDAEIQEAIHLILATVPGERPMRPEFGCGVHQFLFAPADGGTAGLMALEVRRALDRWEPRITVTNVDVSVDEVERNCLWIDIGYEVLGNNDPRNLVFPFYVIPEEGS
jgi:phage baseplate assembly protein W